MKILHSRLVTKNVYLLFAVLTSIFLTLFLRTYNYFFLVGFIIFLLSCFRKPKIFPLIICSFAIIFFVFYFMETKPYSGYIKGEFKVQKVVKSGFIINYDNSNILVFSKSHVFFGDKVYLSGRVLQSAPEYKNYLLSLNVRSVMFYPKIKITENVNNIFFHIHNWFSTGPEKYKTILPLILTGKKSHANIYFYNLTTNLNLAHLLVVSGFHLYLLKSLVSLLFYKARLIVKNIITFWFLLFYIFLIGFPTSALRAFLVIVSMMCKKTFKLKFSNLEILGCVLFVLVVINPFSLYSYSLPLSMISALVISVINDLNISKFKKTLLIPCSVLIFILPFIVKISGSFSIFGPLVSLLITPLFALFFITCLGFIFWKSFVNEIIKIFEKMLLFLNKINYVIDIPRNSSHYLFFFYFFIATCFIIYEIWNLFLDKKSFLRKKQSKITLKK